MWNTLSFSLQIYIASEVLGVSKEKLLCDGFEVNNDMLDVCHQYVVNKKPLSKIFGKKSFWKYDFYTNEHTLDPRPQTENLIELILSHGHTDTSLLELGVGTGAIIITLMKEMRINRSLGIDCCPKTLQVCKKNCALLNVNPELRINNWLENIDEYFDILVSNPPYLLFSEWVGNFAELQYDPWRALVASDSGLDFYRRILKKQHLFKYIYLEVPQLRMKEVESMFSFRNHVYLVN